MENPAVGREMRENRARLEAMQRRTHVSKDVSDVESDEIEVE